MGRGSFLLCRVQVAKAWDFRKDASIMRKVDGNTLAEVILARAETRGHRCQACSLEMSDVKDIFQKYGLVPLLCSPCADLIHAPNKALA